MDRDPDSVVLDMVLRYQPTMRLAPGEAFVSRQLLYMLVANNLAEVYGLSINLSWEGGPSDGQEGRPLRFCLYRLGPTVWKLSPSIRAPRLHGYVTIVGCPDPAPWEEA